MNHRISPASILGVAVVLVWPWVDVRAQQPQTAATTPAVNIDLKDGRVVPATALVMQGDVLLATQQVGTGTGQIGYALATIERVEFPDPPQIAATETLLEQNKAADALSRVDPILSYYAPFKAVPGNWWLDAALAKLDVLAALKREREFDLLLNEISRLPNNPQYGDSIRVRAAESSLRQGQPDKATPIFDDLIRTGTNADGLARAWVGKGQVALAARDYDSALLAFLRVPIFYPNDRAVMPVALLGSGQAFVGIDNLAKAQEVLKQLISDYPQSAEAARAKLELQKADPSSAKPAS